jgi:hypothetical protein
VTTSNRLVNLLVFLSRDHLSKTWEHDAAYTERLDRFRAEVDRRIAADEIDPLESLEERAGRATRELTDELCAKSDWTTSPLHQHDLRTAWTVSIGSLIQAFSCPIEEAALWGLVTQLRFGPSLTKSTQLTVELKRLNGEGFTDELLTELRGEFPEVVDTWERNQVEVPAATGTTGKNIDVSSGHEQQFKEEIAKLESSIERRISAVGDNLRQEVASLKPLLEERIGQLPNVIPNPPTIDDPIDILHAMDDSAMMNYHDLADKLKLEREPLRSRLDRFRKANPKGWEQIAEPMPRKPSYLYRVGAIRQLLKDAIANCDRVATGR